MATWKIYKRHFLFFELLISIIIVVLFVFLLLRSTSIQNIEKWISINKDTIFPLLATISGTLLGFIITVMSIIIVFPETKRIRVLKQSNQYKTVLKVYLSAVKYLSAMIIFSIIGLGFNGYLEMIFSFIVLGLLIVSFFRIWRCIWVLKKMIEIFNEDKRH